MLEAVSPFGHEGVEAPGFMTAGTTAKALKVSPATVRNWRLSGRLRATKRGKSYLFRADDIYALADTPDGEERLTKRANKKASTKRFAPKEYSLSKANVSAVNSVIDSLGHELIDKKLSEVLFICSLLYLRDIKVMATNAIELDAASLIAIRSAIKRPNLKDVFSEWHATLDTAVLNDIKHKVAKIKFEQEKDLLGFLYQSMLQEGKKAALGSYYTPRRIVESMVADLVGDSSRVADLVGDSSRVADPCCGTGQFLLSFAATIKDPANIYGFDIDPIAARLARINLILAYPDIDFKPQIHTLNMLAAKDAHGLRVAGSFDVVATNPPWGAEHADALRSKVSKAYPQIKSFETFSYFMVSSLELLKDQGILSFILPEAMLNVKQHSDIRKYLLQNFEILYIDYLERPFSGVFSKVIRLDVRKTIPDSLSTVRIKKKGEQYSALQSRFLERADYVIDANINPVEDVILSKVLSTPHLTLKGKADWALGIVTGNNKKFVFSTQDSRRKEPIYKGKDISPFFLKPANTFIEFTPERFQQVAPTHKYRAEEKLVYKFISDRLVFAYDNKQHLTLNSANLLIPRGVLSTKVLAVILNSSLYQFIFKKKYNSIKVLRHHIEDLPLPDLDRDGLRQLEKLAIDILAHKKQKKFASVEAMLFDYFGLTEDEAKIVQSYGVV